MSDLLTTDEARALLGRIARSTLYEWYADCREAVTGGGKKPRIGWNRAKLEKRRAQLDKQYQRNRSA